MPSEALEAANKSSSCIQRLVQNTEHEVGGWEAEGAGRP